MTAIAYGSFHTYHDTVLVQVEWYMYLSIQSLHTPAAAADAIDTLYKTKCWTGCKDQGEADDGTRLCQKGRHVLTRRTRAHTLRSAALPSTLAISPSDASSAGARTSVPSTMPQAQAGYVARHRRHYHDALSHHRHVALVLVETTGAVHPDTIGMLYAWHNEARSEGHADRTAFTARSAQPRARSMRTIYLRLISLAAVIGAALPGARWAKAAKSKLVRDVTLADFMTDTMFL